MKYELTTTTMVYGKITLYRIQRCADGSLGGWIEKKANLSQEGRSWVSGNARVYGDARVSSNMIYATRSDGYGFGIWSTEENIPVITAGCRYFSVEQAYNHWKTTRHGTKLGEETINILDYLVKQYTLLHS